MPEQTNYFDKYLEAQFTQINTSMQNISNSMSDMKGQFTDLQKEVREDNKSTRHWILGSAITFFAGFVGTAVAIFFGFSKLQTSWIQTVISFVGKTVIK